MAPTLVHSDHVGQFETVLETARPTVYVSAPLGQRFARDLEAVRAETLRNLVAASVPPSVLESSVEDALVEHGTARDARSAGRLNPVSRTEPGTTVHPS